jgi:hypothetical protein
VRRMAIFHCQVKIGGKADGKSAVASAAYRAGEQLQRVRDNTTKDYSKKGGVVHKEIMLPGHAPERYRDRETLWNEVEAVEKDANAQLYREFEIALPRELNRKQQIEVTREFARELNKQGMITDIALHDKSDGNPHAHIMCPVRQLDERGNWAQKEKRGYALDEDGNKIPILDPATGNQKIEAKTGRKMWKREKSAKNPWNDRGNVDKWRETWERVCNNALERAGSDARIDRRSHAARGLKTIPQLHEGVVARGIERKLPGASWRVAQNSRVKTINAELKAIDKEARQITAAGASRKALPKNPIKSVMGAAQKIGNILDKGIIKTPAPPSGSPKEDNTPFSMLTKTAQQEKAADHRFDENWDENEGQTLKTNIASSSMQEEEKKQEKKEEKDQQQQEQKREPDRAEPEKRKTTKETKPEMEKPQEVKSAEESVTRIGREEQAVFDRYIEAHKAAEDGAEKAQETERALQKEYAEYNSESRWELNRRLDRLEKLHEKKNDAMRKEIGKEEARVRAEAEAKYIEQSPLKPQLDKLAAVEKAAWHKYDTAKAATTKAQNRFNDLLRSEPKQNVFNKLFGESAGHKAWVRKMAAAEKDFAVAKKAEAAAGKDWMKANGAANTVRGKIQAGAKAAGAKAAAKVKGAWLTSPAGTLANAAITVIQTTITIIQTCLKVLDAHNQTMQEIVSTQQEEIVRVRTLQR